MSKPKFDFSGWATKNDLLCADGRTIRKNAFKDDDGRTVPLVWQHNHEDPTKVIGHALLKNRDEGVYSYCSLNDTEIAKHVKELVRHGDVCSLSIYANKLKEQNGDVYHGVIREVSIVLAGANPGAMIEYTDLEHAEEGEGKAVIWTGDEEGIEMGDGMELEHSEEKAEEKAEEKKEAPKAEEKEKKDDEDDENETIQDVLNTLNEKQKAAVEYLLDEASKGISHGEGEDDDTTLSHEDEGEDDDDDLQHAEDGDETIGDILKTLSSKQKKVVEFMVGVAMQNAADEGQEESTASHAEEEIEEETVMANVFEKNGAATEQEGGVLTHAQLDMIAKDAKKLGSMREAVLQHEDEIGGTITYGFTNMDYLMPEYREYSGDGAPQFIKRETTWVGKVMRGVHHTPFSKVKMTFADITEDEARARGYIKGRRKKEEVFKLLKREVSPTTVYKKQKMDNDDLIDLSSGFDKVAWLKSEMRMMLDEELARAYIIGDGRAADSDDKIREDRIIPVLRDENLFVIRQPLVVEEGQPRGDALLDAVTHAFEQYQGSGNCEAFMTRREHSNLKLLKDKLMHRMFKNDGEIASALAVSAINFMPQMGEETTVRVDESTGKTWKPVVIILDLGDYNVGADKGGSINMFEDFDIDYNQMKYLIETRCSGALTKPFSAIVIEEEVNPS